MESTSDKVYNLNMRGWCLLTLFAIGGACFGQGAKHRVVVEVNVPGTSAYQIVLGNVSNLIKAFAPEKVEVEVVCEGAGVDMLLATGRIASQVRELHTRGVSFVACGNTIRGRHISPGSLPKFVALVPAGVAEVVRKQEAGWSYLKGAY